MKEETSLNYLDHKENGTKIYGIQKTKNPVNAWKIMSDTWGKHGCESEENLKILTDETFRKEILVRAAERICDYRDKLISKEDYENSLLLSDDNTDYLLDFNYFYYSEKSGTYYTSRMEFKDDFNDIWPNQWKIFYELMDSIDIKSVVKEAIELVDKFENIDIIYNEVY